MVALGTDAGVNTVALLTNMQTPLGLTAGNALEVRESVEVLEGGGRRMSSSSPWRWPGRCWPPPGAGDVDPADALTGRRAMDVWRRMIPAQGGDPDGGAPVGQGDPGGAGAGGRRPRPSSTPTRSGWRPGGSGPAGPQGPLGPGGGRRRHARQARRVRPPAAAADAPHRRRAALRPVAGRSTARTSAAASGATFSHSSSTGSAAPTLGGCHPRAPPPTRIPVPGGKVIDEYVGAVNTPSRRWRAVVAPGVGRTHERPGGLVRAVPDAGVRRDHGGAAARSSSTTRTVGSRSARDRRSSPLRGSGCGTRPARTDNVAVCLPAFSPEAAHRDDEWLSLDVLRAVPKVLLHDHLDGVCGRRRSSSSRSGTPRSRRTCPRRTRRGSGSGSARTPTPGRSSATSRRSPRRWP